MQNLLSSRLCSHQKEILELKSLNENLDKIIAVGGYLDDQSLQNDVEKDELLSQVLYLHNEVSILSSSSLAKEKEVLRKELEKIKSKLKDTEYKLKNTIQDKVKLEGEKAQAEREIKSLQGQRAILDRDILKRDSLFDRRRESRSDCNKNKAFNALAQQNLQINAFELESKIAYLEEALEAVVGEKEEAFVRNGILDSELEAMANKLTSAYSEMELLREEIAQMQLTDALLETEVEKYSWVSREKTLCEKLKVSNDEIMKLSAKLLKVQSFKLQMSITRKHTI
ncbi:hypothetical protein AXF42_Ash018590 [Apostasia shenzhenica]|uniref:Uncharacterized protein n=1 Tax=Apostasia shenzhenica TaxID=1088818 RepID=A0A2I0AQ14_9ASPA|nr:hypothetical protein AXF42_Ash018590 [Apostasia shenzhenica]